MFRRYLGAIDRVDAPDPQTVRIVLKEPFGAFLQHLAYDQGFAVGPAALAKHGKDIAKNPVGTGPDRFDSRCRGRASHSRASSNTAAARGPVADYIASRRIPATPNRTNRQTSRIIAHSDSAGMEMATGGGARQPLSERPTLVPKGKAGSPHCRPCIASPP